MIRLRLLALCAVFAFAASPAVAQQKTADITVAQAFQSLLYLPLYVGIDKGFFTKHGVNVNKVTAGSGANGVAQVIQGSAMFSLQDPMTAVLANLKGAKLKSVGSVVNGLPVWIIVPKDSPIKTLADLNGKTIATAIPPSTSTYLLEALLKSKNINATEQKVLLGTEIAPVLAGKVDAAAVYEPYLEQAIAQGARVLYEFSRSVPGGYAFSCFDATDVTLKTKPEVVQNFIAGLNDAINYINADPNGATEVAISEFPSLAPDLIKAGMKRMLREKVFPVTALIEKSAFENALALQVSVGNIKPGTVTYADAIDPSFAEKVKK